MADPLPPFFNDTEWEDPFSIPSTPFQRRMLAVVYVVAGAALLAYILRMYSKISARQLGIEDWFMTAAVVFTVALDIATYPNFKYGYVGFPVAEIPEHNFTPALFWTFIAGLLYNPCLALVKSSMLFFMLRIAGHMTEILWSCHVINAINLCLMIATFLVVIFQTTPISAYWDFTVRGHFNINPGLFSISTAILTIITDVLVLAIPVYTFIGLKTSRATRAGVILIFLTSGVVTVIGVLRVIAFARLFFERDTTYDFGNTWGPSWSTIEPNVAIVAACIPSMTPIFRRWLPCMSLASSGGKKASRYGKRGYYGEGSRSIQLHTVGRTRGEIRGGLRPDESQEEMVGNAAGETTLASVSFADTEGSGLGFNQERRRGKSVDSNEGDGGSAV